MRLFSSAFHRVFRLLLGYRQEPASRAVSATLLSLKFGSLLLSLKMRFIEFLVPLAALTSKASAGPPPRPPLGGYHGPPDGHRGPPGDYHEPPKDHHESLPDLRKGYDKDRKYENDYLHTTVIHGSYETYAEVSLPD